MVTNGLRSIDFGYGSECEEDGGSFWGATTAVFIRQNGRKPERATVHQSWLLTKETHSKHKH